MTINSVKNEGFVKQYFRAILDISGLPVLIAKGKEQLKERNRIRGWVTM